VKKAPNRTSAFADNFAVLNETGPFDFFSGFQMVDAAAVIYPGHPVSLP
jgi:hypothetical protein